MLASALLALLFGGPAPYTVGAAKGPYFLCDDRVVEDRWLVDRFVVPLTRSPANPVIVKQQPWEGSGPHAGGAVLCDPASQKFMMWYSVFDAEAWKNRTPFSYNVCFAESINGIDWARTDLGVFEYRGATTNNVINLGTDKTQNIDVAWNPRPDRWPGKFLSIHNQRGGVFVSWSNDGHRFTRLFDKPIISYHSDTHNNFVFDEVRERWLLYCRPRAWAGYHRRRIALQTSVDLENWSHERTILIPTENEIPEYYGIGVFRRGDLYFGIVQVYETKTGSMHGELAWSEDGARWSFLPTHPKFLSLGPKGAWDGGMVAAFESPVAAGNELRFYYGGFRSNHNTPPGQNAASIGLATAEKDRLIGMRPSTAQPGLIMTRPITMSGKKLKVNATIRGRILAELRTDDNKPIPGYMFADCKSANKSGFEQLIDWQSPTTGLTGEVRILFRLESAELFTFELTD